VKSENHILRLLLERQEERKIAFLNSGQIPWSREEWRWHKEWQQEALRKAKGEA
jgi:hypothetical protein